MKVLIVGSGGREHAIAWKLAQSPKVNELFCAPGNAGIAQISKCIDIDSEDISGICDFAKKEGIDLAVIGPEGPLSQGIVDVLEENGIRTFGPNRSCARLEASKSFTKHFLERHSIPTAKYKEFTDIDALKNAIGLYGYPMVLKADGLAAGKGVILAQDAREAEEAIDQLMGDKVFGTAGEKVVVEECLIGVEASVLCFVDEHSIVPMASAQDYKRIFDGDQGQNTGGMGTYSPSLLFTPDLEQKIRRQILEPTLKGFQQDGLNFKGVLFIGIMITEEGPKVIEFNNRFGDPEAQSILPRLENDLLEVFEAVIENRLSSQTLNWKEERAVCVVLASGGYPGNYAKGLPITGLDSVKDALVFHAGTSLGPDGKTVLTNGGRVLGITALGKTHDEARLKAYRNAEKITFEGLQYRKDIGRLDETAYKKYTSL